MNVAMRVDASFQIGTGHVMRCLALADALKLRGSHIRFLSRHMPQKLRQFIIDGGHESVLLDGEAEDFHAGSLAHAGWLGRSQESDARDCVDALSDRAWDWLVADHYALDICWESTMRQCAGRILAIDDIADRHHHCDVLIDQNYHADMVLRYAGKLPPGCTLLLGPSYALLRDEFRRVRERTSPRTGPVARMLVFFGGVDSDNLTGRAIEILARLEVGGFGVDCVIGQQHPQRALIEEQCMQNEFALHVQTQRMAELMAAADLAIGAAGSATWERCCVGLPAVVVSLAENQVELAKGLEALGGGVYLGAVGEVGDAELRAGMLAVMQNRDVLRALSRNAYAAVDGRGVDRVCDVMAGHHEH